MKVAGKMTRRISKDECTINKLETFTVESTSMERETEEVVCSPPSSRRSMMASGLTTNVREKVTLSTEKVNFAKLNSGKTSWRARLLT